ncbi:hypothetical protein ACF09I_25720 [Streptomyces sp. NPDC014940]|uniref:hypothetical protein n=1 Tax=Streptomyces sp. NPDC014940 TaxID=3364932 RepID=UPI0036F97FB6
MSRAPGRPTGSRHSAVRCAWTMVITLFAALAVLAHHDTSAIMPTQMAGMTHTSSIMTPATASEAGHGTALRVVHTPMDEGSGACSGSAVQHCSAGDVSTAKPVSPPAAVAIIRSDTFSIPSAGTPLSAASDRAPPDLSVLSRLLI